EPHEAFWEAAGALCAPASQCTLDEVERGHKANARRAHTGLCRDTLSLESYKVVGKCQTPKFLCDALGTLAARGLLAREHHALDLVVPKLHLPAFVVERNDLVGGVAVGIEQRGEQELRFESATPIADGTHPPCERHRRVLLPGFS